MKTKFTVIAGYLGFISLFAPIFWLIDDLGDNLKITSFLFFITLFFNLYYLIKTKFWATKVNELDKLEEENRIIEKQIKKKGIRT